MFLEYDHPSCYCCLCPTRSKTITISNLRVDSWMITSKYPRLLPSLNILFHLWGVLLLTRDIPVGTLKLAYLGCPPSRCQQKESEVQHFYNFRQLGISPSHSQSQKLDYLQLQAESNWTLCKPEIKFPYISTVVWDSGNIHYQEMSFQLLPYY